VAKKKKTYSTGLFVLVLIFVSGVLVRASDANASRRYYERGRPHRGFYELSLRTEQTSLNPYADVELQVVFERPDGSNVTVDGFYDGGGVFKARAYCDTVGKWRWTSSSNVFDLSSESGAFEVKKTGGSSPTTTAGGSCT